MRLIKPHQLLLIPAKPLSEADREAIRQMMLYAAQCRKDAAIEPNEENAQRLVAGAEMFERTAAYVYFKN